MATRKAFLVTGSIGDYGVHDEWPIKVFMVEESAKQFLVALEARATEILKISAQMDSLMRDKECQRNELDPQMRFYGGEIPDYGYEELELVED